MLLGHTNLKLWVAVNAIVLYVCKLTELRKKQLKVEILHDLKEFLKEFLNFIWLLKLITVKFLSFSKKYYSCE